MKKIRRIVIAILVVAMISAIGLFVVSSNAVSDDPATNYEYQDAPYEDYSLDMWFDYSFRKTFTSDTRSTGMDTFSIYMAKNEVESCQFVLYSDDDYTGMTAEVTDFTDGNGNTVDAEIYYEYYITTDHLNKNTVWGATASNNFIREGETPDPIAPLANIGTFNLIGGKSQAFLIRAKTDFDAAPGWYSAQLNVKDNEGYIIKTATVYLHVWDFALSDKTALETAFLIDGDSRWGGNYKVFYDYMLDHRMCGFDIPQGTYKGLISSTNPYILKDRVVSMRLAGGEHGYLDSNYRGYAAIYNDLVSAGVFDQVKDKIYAYTADEPLPQEIVGSARDTGDSTKASSGAADAYWGGQLRTLVTPCEDHAYPYGVHNNPLSTYSQGELRDVVQEFINTDSVRIWCPRIYEFTPYSAIQSLSPRRWENYDPIRNASIYPYSGAYGRYGAAGVGYFDWEGFYGASTTDRYLSDITFKNNTQPADTQREVWAYSAGYNKSYTYCNHVIENTGLQTKMLFWQLYQNDITGYLYYASNGWTENANSYYDATQTGGRTNVKWYVNRYSTDNGNFNVFGNGVLFYARDMGKVHGVDVIGSLRAELMNDGIEEYQMFYQLAELKGEARAKTIVGWVCNSVVDYLSMPNYNRGMWSSSMDDYDVMEAVRRQLGIELEEATLETQCEHTWNAGVVSTPATCAKTGRTTFTCTTCGAQRYEVIPSIHSQNTTFTKVSGIAPSCTSDGNEVYRCSLCGFEKPVITNCFHNNPDYIEYVDRAGTSHGEKCKVCGETVGASQHAMFYVRTEPTCSSAGSLVLTCRDCGHVEDEYTTEIPALGHNYVDGVCTVCGESEEPEITVTYGDLNGDGKVTATDINMLSKALVGTVSLSEAQATAADVSGDGKTTATDTNLINKYLSGTISAFPVELQ